MTAPRRRRGLVAVWLALAALVAVILVLDYGDRWRQARHDADPDPRLLLPVSVEQLGAVEIADRGTLHRFERDAAGGWLYHGTHAAAEADHRHAADPVLAERIGRALTAFGRTRVERRFGLDPAGDPYGVTTPQIVILAYRPAQAQPFVQYAVGHLAPDTTSLYLTVVGSREVVTIPSYQVDNLLALVQAAGERAAAEAGRR